MAISLEGIIAIAWTLNAFAIILTIGRYLIRYKVINSFHLDDVTHLLAVLLMITNTSIVTGVADLVRSVQSYSDHESTTKPDFHAYLQVNVSTTVVGFSCLWAVKATFLLLYRLLFKVSRAFLRAWWAVTLFVFITYWVVIAGALTQCGGSASSLLNIKLCESPSSLRLQRKTFIYSCTLNVASDFITLGLAIGMLRTIQIKKRQKIGLTVLFSLSLLIIFFELLRMGESLKGTGHSVNTLWFQLEASVAIIVSSLPTYNALLKHREKTRTYEDDSYARLASSTNARTTNDAGSGKDSSIAHNYHDEILMSDLQYPEPTLGRVGMQQV